MTALRKANPEGRSQGTRRTAQKGRSILQRLIPSLLKRGVSSSSYIVVNTGNGEFVTGKTREEAGDRFKLMHPGARGWMQRFGDAIVESGDTVENAQSSDISEPARPSDGKPRIARW